MKRPQLGQKCRIKATCSKAKIYLGYGKRQSRWLTDTNHMSSHPEGLYVGYRTVADGVTGRDEDGYVNSYEVTEYHEVWLFVDNPRKKIFYAFPEYVEFKDEVK
jgi:hypothetical protein